MANYRWEFEATGATDAVKMATALDRMEKSATALTPALHSLSTALITLSARLRPLGDAFTKAADGADAFKVSIHAPARGATVMLMAQPAEQPEKKGMKCNQMS